MKALLQIFNTVSSKGIKIKGESFNLLTNYESFIYDIIEIFGSAFIT